MPITLVTSAGEKQFTVPSPGAIESFSLQQRILPVASRIVNVLLNVLAATGSDVDSMSKDLGSILEQDVVRVLPIAMPSLGQVFSEMPEGELEKLTKALLAKASVEVTGKGVPLFGGPGGGAFELFMVGRTLETWKLLWHALEVWYPDFFALAGRFRGPVAGREESSPA